MFKKGFTLAEVLITLGIVGVIAAITLPTLIQDTTAAQVGPKLAKAVSTFEQANQALLKAEGVNAISDAYPTVNTFLNVNEEYVDALTNYMKASHPTTGYTNNYSNTQLGMSGLFVPKQILYTNDGMLFIIEFKIPEEESQGAYTGSLPHKYRLGSVFVDINGNTKPNLAGTDLFGFALYNDGSLRPYGGTNWKTGGDTWHNQCPAGASPSNALYCAGHVFENNLKVLYK